MHTFFLKLVHTMIVWSWIHKHILKSYKFNYIIYGEGELATGLKVYETTFRLSFPANGKAITGSSFKKNTYTYTFYYKRNYLIGWLWYTLLGNQYTLCF